MHLAEGKKRAKLLYTVGIKNVMFAAHPRVLALLLPF
jgi:hypothetical protein